MRGKQVVESISNVGEDLASVQAGGVESKEDLYLPGTGWR
jgi:hypothetical protein